MITLIISSENDQQHIIWDAALKYVEIVKIVNLITFNQQREHIVKW